MDTMLRRALRDFLGLLRQLLTNLLGDNGETWERELKKFLRKESCWVAKADELVAPVIDLATGICKFVADFGKSLPEMIAAGKYDWRNDNITVARFPISGAGTVTVDAKLFHFGRNTTSDEVERELDKAGYRAANIAELLAFGASFPEVQRRFPVIALRSVTEVDGGRYVPYLNGDDGDDAERNLSLYRYDGDWYDYCRFLAVRKDSSDSKKDSPPAVKNLADFFTIRKGLWVSNDFSERILTLALQMEETAPASVGKSFNLPKEMTDAEIHRELGAEHVFENACAFCHYLKNALTKQWGGTNDAPLTNNNANLFYVRGRQGDVFAVPVYWNADHREWRVFADQLINSGWVAGSRAFSRN